MILTTHTMEWLNQNRRRSYPCIREEWRSCSSVISHPDLDCVLLDALLFDPDASGSEKFIIESVSVSDDDDSTIIRFLYGSTTFQVTLTGGSISGESSFVCLNGTINGSGITGASLSLTLSSHAYILNTLGSGSFVLGCNVLPTRIIRLSDGIGVNQIKTNGSIRVNGHESESYLQGEVILEDGYRTSPIISNGQIMVRVGQRYGYDPCQYDFGDSGSRDCSRPLFYFCGQNAINSGNVILRGGKGITVSQGKSYNIDNANSNCDGMTVPCIEIVAGRELNDICNID